MSKKYFTLAEANALLPTLEKELCELQQLKNDLGYKESQLRKMKNAVTQKLQTDTELIFMKESELEFMELEAQLYLSNIHSLGVQLKSIDLGLLDFPALINGEDVLLCWKQGEAEITHYHGATDGYSGRKKLK
ncbi:DUF2203 domain-containing protein [Halalkalibacter alkalisediminis]|uniref:DUF2203 domain-containing protein n=1 Tax=Halalkalibacter alkalisediminis TaxID=935616 RepID=A0ABV6NHD3_9BACI|nr:DUF2203 domain-containing protein [Halalkalibacter alkalisediminis]